MSTEDSFPFPEHDTCGTLTRLTIEHMPRDGSIGRRRNVRKNGQIWQPDDAGDRIYFVVRGEVAIFSAVPLARDLLLQTVGAGEPFGEVCLCAEGKGQRNTVARASTDVVLLEIEFEAFLRYLETHTNALKALVCTLCLRLSDCESRSEILAHRGAQERLGRLLMQLARKAERSGKRPVVLHVTHRELAQMAAMSRAHVSVILGHFRRLKLVQYQRGGSLYVNGDVLASHVASREIAAEGDPPRGRA